MKLMVINIIVLMVLNAFGLVPLCDAATITLYADPLCSSSAAVSTLQLGLPSQCVVLTWPNESGGSSTSAYSNTICDNSFYQVSVYFGPGNTTCQPQTFQYGSITGIPGNCTYEQSFGKGYYQFVPGWYYLVNCTDNVSFASNNTAASNSTPLSSTASSQPSSPSSPSSISSTSIPPSPLQSSPSSSSTGIFSIRSSASSCFNAFSLIVTGLLMSLSSFLLSLL